MRGNPRPQAQPSPAIPANTVTQNDSWTRHYPHELVETSTLSKSLPSSFPTTRTHCRRDSILSSLPLPNPISRCIPTALAQASRPLSLHFCPLRSITLVQGPHGSTLLL